MNTDLLYLYCLTNSKDESNFHLVNRDLSWIESTGFYFLVKHVSSNEFSEENFHRNVTNIGWLDNKVREHLSVINSIMKIHTVIPFKFGTIFKSIKSIETFAIEYESNLQQNFETIEGCEEWSVKVYCFRNDLAARIDELSIETAQMEVEIQQSSAGKAFFLKKKKEILIENEIDELCDGYGQEYFGSFLIRSELTKRLPLTSSDITGRKDTMILNATFLVKKEKVAELAQSTERFRLRDAKTGFDIELSGPWPPFSFISIKEKMNA